MTEITLETGVVSEVFPKMCNVVLNSDHSKKLLCTYRRAQVIDNDKEWRERSPVAPGDLVEVQVLGSRDGVIEKINPRRNCIQRRAPGKDGKVLHTIAANIDLVVIVTSLHDPAFSPGLVDRFLIATQKAGIAPLLVINKTDLMSAADEKPWAMYEQLDITCLPISAKLQKGIEEVREYVTGKTVVFCGHSGVGKTSLLSALFGESMGKVGAINDYTRKGKHTTTVSTLVEAKDKTRFIDTPGIKEFGLIEVDPKELIEYFPEILAAQLKREPLEELPRYETYLRIKAALEDEGR